MIYISVIVVAMFLIDLFNGLFNSAFEFWYFTLSIIGCTFSVIAIDAVFATIVRWLLPKKWFNKDKNFSAGKKECLFYEKVGIKKWKEKVLELGVFANFRKNKIAEPGNNEYIERYIVEAHYGIVVHICCVIFGFGVIGIFYKLALVVALPVALVNMFLNLLPIMVLRYNLPKLKTLYKLNERREKKLKNLSE